MSEELKPCPFCDHSDITKIVDEYVCNCCGASVTIDKWDKRPIEDKLRNKIKQLQSRIELLWDIANI